VQLDIIGVPKTTLNNNIYLVSGQRKLVVKSDPRGHTPGGLFFGGFMFDWFHWLVIIAFVCTPDPVSPGRFAFLIGLLVILYLRVMNG